MLSKDEIRSTCFSNQTDINDTVTQFVIFKFFCVCFTVLASVEQVENKVVIEGDNVEGYCNAAGSPDPTVLWAKVATGEHIEGNPFNITNINRAQAGEYRCTANNTCGEASTVMNINVQCT